VVKIGPLGTVKRKPRGKSKKRPMRKLSKKDGGTKKKKKRRGSPGEKKEFLARERNISRAKGKPRKKKGALREHK